MNRHSKITPFVSEIDQTLQEFDKKHPQLSLSQQKERDEHARLYYLRDVGDRPSQLDILEKNF
ncbi:MAG: hypothetical protein K0S27_655 [Gammaproteobacteria bacterium]|jgi:hypothetical protein|nr:hypothetical protein [Gammaproteobacteria bacterium]